MAQTNLMISGIAPAFFEGTDVNPANVSGPVYSAKEKLNAVPSVHCDVWEFNPKDHKNTVDGFRKMLGERKWNALTIGGGLRKNDDFMLLLEDIVNTVKDHSPHTQMIFVQGPTNILAALASHVEVVKNANIE